MLKLTTILKEDYLPKLLDNPTNRRLLNVIAKNNDLSNIHYNKSNPFLRQMGPVKRFIKDTLYIVDPMKIAELLWLIFLNGDIDYLKDDLDISTDFQVYEIYYYMEMDEEEDERDVDCSDCDGYGTTIDECQMCDGTGEEDSGSSDDEGEPIMVSCVDCEGTGEVTNDCDWCGGSGYESEQFTEYSVEEWRNVYVSKNKNIECPSTISTPFKGGNNENDWTEPASFNRWIGSIPKEELILITKEFQERLTEEYESYVEEESGKIRSCEVLHMDDPMIGFHRFLRNNLWGK
tara:strand:+ start:54 stop:923 length:870 start_codon:yes stop_codon:yes gene_type:complete